MTATDELRRMLTEAGVEWEDYQHENHTWWLDGNDVCWHAENWLTPSSMLLKIEATLTPAQAIAATVGASERESYDAGFASGIKAALQQLYGLLHEYPTLDEIEAWADSQWEEYE